MAFNLQVNGKTEIIDADAAMPLLWVLRDRLKLTGTKYGCGIAQCGACTVLVDGIPMRSCITPASALVGQQISTIEGANSATSGALQSAWQALNVPQCGYCQSGQILTATSLLAQNKAPSDADIDAAMAGNLCRCATYGRIRAGIKQAAAALA
jgi:isoquinoline 1-oxidoreductase subunit alpha